MKYWLFKTEPSTFGVEHMARARNSTTAWDGVRNYQARNMLRDQMKKGDLGFLYHSSCDEPGITGIVRVVREGYPEAAALDPKNPYFDPDSDPEQPRWYSVDIHRLWPFDHKPMQRLKVRSKIDSLPFGCRPMKMILPA